MSGVATEKIFALLGIATRTGIRRGLIGLAIDITVGIVCIVLTINTVQMVNTVLIVIRKLDVC